MLKLFAPMLDFVVDAGVFVRRCWISFRLYWSCFAYAGVFLRILIKHTPVQQCSENDVFCQNITFAEGCTLVAQGFYVRFVRNILIFVVEDI